MRRLCFDTESSAYNRDIGVVSDVDTSREQMAELHRRETIRFDCGVLYDEHENQFEEFTSRELPALVAKLATADVLITQNGKRWDIPILEQLCGSTATSLRSIKHKDLMELTNWQTLNSLAKHYISDRLPGMEQAYHERLAKADRRFPGCRWGSSENFRPPEYLIACKLAKARFDVERTFTVFRVLEEQ